MRWRESFSLYTRGQRRGIIVLVLLITLVLLIDWFRQRSPNEHEPTSNSNVPAVPSVTDTLGHEQSGAGSPVELAAFDPNEADSLRLRGLGLSGRVTSNILRYRAKGGRFRKAEEFRKIYGLSAEQYATLRPYIYIAPKTDLPAGGQRKKPAKRTQPAPFLLDTLALQAIAPVEKYAEGTQVDLNRADTTELQKIPGIGRTIARMIVTYRQRLGGFYCTEQLSDIHLRAQLLRQWFTVDTTLVRRIPLNKAGVGALRAHPYLNYYQAKAIVTYRKKHGALTNLKPLALYEEFTPEELERISHYVSFE
ncbi:MAG: helix-hairpin-helix domain-containing protein [Prevotellaceae bacterium]|jgi:competence ComEA-like helix-hairpin-helix protein|nr:helix-hairpin-helix domain-containing protein [Prevotellaceae bacterium]